MKQDLCKFCNHKKLVSIICILDESKMCEGCAKNHAQRIGHLSHLTKYEDWLKKQTVSNTNKNQTTQQFQVLIQSALDALPATEESLNIQLESRKLYIKDLIKKISDEQSRKITDNYNFAKYQFEKSFHALYSRKPSSSGLAHIISNFSKEEEVDDLVFSEVVNPEGYLNIKNLLYSSMDIGFKVYPDCKPCLIPYLRPNSSTVNWFNTITEKIKTVEIVGKIFSMHTSWCYLSNYDIVFSGGCTSNYINYEVFTFSSDLKSIEYYPPMQTERYMHGMASLNGIIYVFGGVTSEGNTELCECLKVGASNWESCAPLNSAKVRMTVCVLNDKIYIGDENDIEVFSPLERSCKVVSVFKESQFMIMLPFRNDIMILRKDKIYAVQPEPTFRAKQLSKIQEMEYCCNGQAVLIGDVVYFMLDVNKAVYMLDLQRFNIKLIGSLS